MKTLLTLVLSGGLSLLIAAPSSIGFVRSSGTFRVDGSTIRGNGTLVEGNVVETTVARSIVQIGAVQIALLPDSRAKLYRDHAIFEKGAGVARGADRYVIEANVLRIAPAARDSVVQVEMRGASTVAVAATTGSASVRNAAGVLLANLQPGEALAFDPQSGAAEAIKVSGVLQERDGHYFVTDSTTNVTVELQGSDLAKYVGKRVTVSGSTIPTATPAPGASEVVNVVSINALAGGLSRTTIGLIIGGVAVGGTLAGLGAAGTFSGGSSSASTP
jgi:hypothetical protein